MSDMVERMRALTEKGTGGTLSYDEVQELRQIETQLYREVMRAHRVIEQQIGDPDDNEHDDATTTHND